MYQRIVSLLKAIDELERRRRLKNHSPDDSLAGSVAPLAPDDKFVEGAQKTYFSPQDPDYRKKLIASGFPQFLPGDRVVSTGFFKTPQRGEVVRHRGLVNSSHVYDVKWDPNEKYRHDKPHLIAQHYLTNEKDSKP